MHDMASKDVRCLEILTNGIVTISSKHQRAKLGSGPARLRRALEVLARLSPYAAGMPERIFLREQSRLPHGPTLVCVTPAASAARGAAVARVRRMCRRLPGLHGVAPRGQHRA